MNKTYRNRLAFNMRQLAACLLLILGFACYESQQPNYVITGSIPGAKNGDVVYLEEIQNMEVTKLDSAVVRNGHFTFKGYQDSTVLRYLSCITENEAFSFPFFLESGELQAKMVSGNESVTGTLHNNIFQKIRTQSFKLLKQMDYIEKDSTLNEQQKQVQLDATERAYAHIQKRGMRDNITNPVGIYLFKMNYYENSLTENLELFKRIPSKYHNDIELRGIGKQLEAQKKTAVSTPFTDLTLQTPEGKPSKLSDYIGKGKPVVVDFWASWCAPCRQAMPDLVKLYKEYQGKIEIVGISLDENQESWKEAIQRLGITWPQLSDLKGWKSSAAHTYGIHTIPHLLLIDPSGTIIARNISHDEIATYLKSTSK